MPPPSLAVLPWAVSTPTPHDNKPSACRSQVPDHLPRTRETGSGEPGTRGRAGVSGLRLHLTPDLTCWVPCAITPLLTWERVLANREPTFPSDNPWHVNLIMWLREGLKIHNKFQLKRRGFYRSRQV